MAKKQTDPQYNVRMPADLKAKIEASAERLNRTINADIVARLTASFVKVQINEEPFEPLSWLANMKRRVDAAEEARDRGEFQKICEEIMRTANVSREISERASLADWLMAVSEEETGANRERALQAAWMVSFQISGAIEQRVHDIRAHSARRAKEILGFERSNRNDE